MIDQITVLLKPSWFNPLYYHLVKYMSDESIRRILIYGGSSAGKSYSVAQSLVTEGFEDNYSSIMFRKEQSNIKDTIKNDISDVLEKIGYLEVYRKMDFEFRNYHTEAVIKLRGLDKDSKIKGLMGYKKLYFDELDQFTYNDWAESNRRLRGELGQQLLASWNPVDENHWIKKKILDTTTWSDLPKVVELKGKGGKDLSEYTKLDVNSWVRISEDKRTILIKVTHQDNKWVVGGNIEGKEYGFIDTQALADFEEMKRIDPQAYQVYGLGEWGQVRNDAPYFQSWDRAKQVKKELKPVEGLELSVGMDFNYGRMAMVVGQKIPAQRINVFDCIEGKTIKEVCEKFDVKYGAWQWGFKIYGDASGKNKNAMTGAYNYYHEVMSCLKVPSSVFAKRHKRNANLQHSQSRTLVNYIFGLVPTYFDESLVELLKEIEKAQVVINHHTGKENLRKDDNVFSMDRVDAMRYLMENLCVDVNEAKIMRKFIEKNNPEEIAEYGR